METGTLQRTVQGKGREIKIKKKQTKKEKGRENTNVKGCLTK